MDTCACADDSNREEPPDGHVTVWKRTTSLFSCVADTGSLVKLADANLINTMYTEHRRSLGHVFTNLRAFCFRVTGQLRFYKLNLAISGIPATDFGI
ncbi:hypothetical protein V2G26_020788 [Clonostachys chloroleuca]